jgi:hypothetical protein
MNLFEIPTMSSFTLKNFHNMLDMVVHDYNRLLGKRRSREDCGPRPVQWEKYVSPHLKRQAEPDYALWWHNPAIPARQET